MEKINDFDEMTGESRIYRKSTGRQGIILRDKGIVLRRESFNKMNCGDKLLFVTLCPFSYLV